MGTLTYRYSNLTLSFPATGQFAKTKGHEASKGTSAAKMVKLSVS